MVTVLTAVPILTQGSSPGPMDLESNRQRFGGKRCFICECPLCQISNHDGPLEDVISGEEESLRTKPESCERCSFGCNFMS